MTDKVLNHWYAKDEKNIEKYKYLIMLDLKEEDSARLPRDGKVRKFMSEVKRGNENPTFMLYMTKDEDNEDDGCLNLKKPVKLEKKKEK